MKADKDKVVVVTYILKEKDAEGKTIEVADKENPFPFILGTGGVLPKFEKAINGKSVGDKFSVSIPCKEAYGKYDTQMAAVEVEKEIFDLNEEEEEAMFKKDHILPMVDQDGNKWDGKVVKVLKNTLILDFNHELAELDLYFEGEILEVRNATDEELGFGEDEEIEVID